MLKSFLLILNFTFFLILLKTHLQILIKLLVSINIMEISINTYGNKERIQHKNEKKEKNRKIDENESKNEVNIKMMKIIHRRDDFQMIAVDS